MTRVTMRSMTHSSWRRVTSCDRFPLLESFGESLRHYQSDLGPRLVLSKLGLVLLLLYFLFEVISYGDPLAPIARVVSASLIAPLLAASGEALRLFGRSLRSVPPPSPAAYGPASCISESLSLDLRRCEHLGGSSRRQCLGGVHRRARVVQGSVGPKRGVRLLLFFL
ncbi:hypothetical protein GW17_00012923 [Ensete ventricosum]|nr:hypothetical protein GW17_00012923 [Ensete ventricosum]RZR96509.1 hypothetical protein BHM03_00025545 [Ensete ventricosum]